jgi:hypothetical protein
MISRQLRFFSFVILMDFSKKKLEHCGTLHVPYKYVGLFRKRFKLTKVPKWPSFLMLNLIFKVKFILNLINFLQLK